jgi:exo-beta-1,3-glucanase (GH17 family)
MNRANILVAIAIAVIFSSMWALFNRPEHEPAWPNRIQGFSFSPFRHNQSAIDHLLPTVEEINADLALLANKTHAVRTYTMEGSLAEIPRLARKHKLNVTLGAWLDADAEKSNAELDKLISVARENYHNVVRVVVGNEAILRGDLKVDEIIPYLERARETLDIPVSTAEPWHVWLKYPELVDHVDYIAVHMLPYWEGVHVERAVDYVVDHINLLKASYPEKQIVIAEVGWPSNGRTRHSAVATNATEATFLRRFLARAAQEKYVYYVMEADEVVLEINDRDRPCRLASKGDPGYFTIIMPMSL